MAFNLAAFATVAAGGRSPARAPARSGGAAPGRQSRALDVYAQSSVSWLVAAVAGGAAAALTRRRQRKAAVQRSASAQCSRCNSEEQPEELFVAFDATSRRSVAAGAAGAAVSPFLIPEEYAAAFAGCLECAAEGIRECMNCKGSGQFKLFGDRGVTDGVKYQYVECPDCYGAGQIICPLCFGTGLPKARLRGFLRDPEFAPFVKRIKDNKVDPENIKEIQAEIQVMLANKEKRKAEKKAQKELDKAQGKDDGLFGVSLPNFFA